MFGLGFGEVVLLIIVAIVVVGPRQLPSMMRTAGQWVSRIRRMSTDLRAQSGIDQLMREEGIDRSIQELRALQNINVLDGLERMAQPAPVVPPARGSRPAARTGLTPPSESKSGIVPTASLLDKPAQDKPPETKIEEIPGKVPREREYPLLGCDSYGALPDDAAPYGAVATADPMGANADKTSSGGATSV
ncbi:MAG TPA: Sec-independent protein translocase protein TatB [Polyangium sp.]|nr:Sec-independent protein translocase protein TatB [Polyangium sp.]